MARASFIASKYAQTTERTRLLGLGDDAPTNIHPGDVVDIRDYDGPWSGQEMSEFDVIRVTDIPDKEFDAIRERLLSGTTLGTEEDHIEDRPRTLCLHPAFVTADEPAIKLRDSKVKRTPKDIPVVSWVQCKTWWMDKIKSARAVDIGTVKSG